MKKLLALLLLVSPALAQTPPTGVSGLDFTPNNSLATAASGHARIRYNSGTGKFQQSISTGAWVDFGGGGTVTSVTASAPLLSSGGATPNLSCPTCLNGTLSATGDMVYSTAGGAAVSRLADVSAGSYLRSGGVGSAPLWSTTTLPNSATTGDVLYASAANTYSNLADVGAGSYLRSGGVGTAPVWSTVALPNSATKGDIIYATAANTYGNLADVATGQVLRSGGVGNTPTYGIQSLQQSYNDGGTGLITIGSFGPINGRHDNVLQNGTANSGAVVFEASNSTQPPNNNPGSEQYSPIVYLNSFGWSASVGGGTPEKVGWLLQSRGIQGGHASPQLEFSAVQSNAVTPQGTEMMRIVVDPTDSGLGNPTVTELGSNSLFFIIQADGNDGAISLRANVTDVTEARGVRFSPISPVTYANAQITAWENPAGTPLATVGPTGEFHAPQYTIQSPGTLLIGSTTTYNLAASVQIGGQGTTNPAIIAESTADYSNGAHMQEWKSHGTLLMSAVYGAGGGNPQFVSPTHAMSVFNDNTDGIQMGNNTTTLLIGGTGVARANVNSQWQLLRAELFNATSTSSSTFGPNATDQEIQSTRSSTGTGSVTLPLATTGAGRVIYYEDFGTGGSAQSIAASGGDTIIGLTAFTGTRVMCTSDGTSKWLCK